MHCPGAIEITTMCQCDNPKLARRNRKILSNIIPTFTGTSCIGSVKFNISNSNFSPVLSLTIAYHLLQSSSIFRTIFLCFQNRLVITEIAKFDPHFPSPIVDKTSFQTDLRSSGTICRPELASTCVMSKMGYPFIGSQLQSMISSIIFFRSKMQYITR